jgi:peptide/nickel transport system substrate-binding protein
MHSRRYVGLLLAVVLGGGCGADSGGAGGSGEADVPEADRYGGTAVVGLINDMPDLSPLTSTDHNAAQIQQYVLFMPLVTYDANFEPQPYLARSWELSPDSSHLTFHLRDDVFWHDGVRTTAHDVAFSYELARDPETGFANSAFWTHYGDAEVVDSLTFRVAIRPHADYLDPWRAFAPVPRHVLEGVPALELRTHAFSTSTPVGNGPFRFVSRQPGQNWVFGANEQHPEELGGRPYLDRIVYRVVSEPTTLLTELLTGRVDYYIQPTPEQAAQIEASPGARLHTFDDRAFVIIGWNARRPMFSDPRVRRALTMAIDREEIIDAIVYGYGSIANSPVPPIFWQYDEGAGEDLGFDVEAAGRLLDEAGWRDRNGDGIRENERGEPFRFSILTSHGNQERVDILAKVQSDLRRVGIQMEPQVQEWGALLSRINDVENRDFDAVLIGWVTEFRIDDRDLFHCDRLDEPYQWVGYCDPEADELLDRLPLIVDRDEARPLWQRYQRLIARDQPYTFLYFQQRREGIADRLRGVDPDARGDWVGARDWWILPDRR